MKTLSVKQPWAWLICAGYKDIENRTRKTNYRGRILIHASKTKLEEYYEIITEFSRAGYTIVMIYDKKEYKGKCIPFYECSEMQAIIGEVTIVDCVQNYKSKWAEPGSWHWVLADPVLYDKPILNIKGKLGLWEYPMI